MGVYRASGTGATAVATMDKTMVLASSIYLVTFRTSTSLSPQHEPQPQQQLSTQQLWRERTQIYARQARLRFDTCKGTDSFLRRVEVDMMNCACSL